MRVGFVRSVALGMVALVGFAGCDDNPTDFDNSTTTSIMTNPSAMVLPAGQTALLSSRTINAGDEPTWEEMSAEIDGSCGSGAITVAEAATYEPSIQPPGQFDVTGGTTLGEACITLNGGGATSTVEVTVIGDSLGITAPADQVLYTEDASGPSTTLQLTATLLSAQEEAVQPFDQVEDVVWTVDDESIITVDENGLATAVGVGAATVTGTWSGGGTTVESTFPITVNPPETAVINSLSASSGPMGTEVTVNGTGLVSIMSVFINGTEASLFQLGDPSPTEVTFMMPNLAGLGDYDIQVGLAGDLSDVLTFTLTTENSPLEPDSPGAPQPIPSIPFSTVDFMDDADIEDFYFFTLAEDASVDLVMESVGNDIDVIIADATFSVIICDAQTAAIPEVIEACELEAGGYFVYLINFAETDTAYRLDLEFTPTDE